MLTIDTVLLLPLSSRTKNNHLRLSRRRRRGKRETKPELPPSFRRSSLPIIRPCAEIETNCFADPYFSSITTFVTLGNGYSLATIKLKPLWPM